VWKSRSYCLVCSILTKIQQLQIKNQTKKMGVSWNNYLPLHHLLLQRWVVEDSKLTQKQIEILLIKWLHQNDSTDFFSFSLPSIQFSFIFCNFTRCTTTKISLSIFYFCYSTQVILLHNQKSTFTNKNFK